MKGKKTDPITALQEQISELELKLLNSQNSLDSAEKKLEEKDELIDLWKNYSEGLESRIEIYERGEKMRNKQTMGPLLQGIGGGLLGAALYGVGASIMRENKKP